MKRGGVYLLAAVAIAIMFSGSALAQGDASYYFVTYYSNNVSGAPDATVRFINDGNSPYFDGYLFPYFFVFDDSQELQECGICEISPDGLLSEDVKTELTSNTLTGIVPARGVIKVYEYFERAGLRGWATHIERATPTSGAYATTEAPLADSNLSDTEYSSLYDLCYYAQQLGSGKAAITCTTEDSDF